MDLGRALRHNDQQGKAAKRRRARADSIRRGAGVARVVVVVALFVGFAALALDLGMGDGPLVYLAFAAKWLAMPFLWFGAGALIHPATPMLLPTRVHRRVRLPGENTDMLVHHEGAIEPITPGRRGGLALITIGVALYAAAVVMLVMGRPLAP